MNLRNKQKTLKKTLLTALLVIASLSPSTTRASCQEALDDCDRALNDSLRVIDLKTKQIETQDKIIAAADTRILELQKQNNSIFRNPWLYGALGIVVGVIIVK